MPLHQALEGCRVMPVHEPQEQVGIGKAPGCTLAEAGDRLSANERMQIEKAVTAVRTAIAADDLNALRPAVAELGRVTTHLAGEAMNAVVKKALSGKTEADVRAGSL